MATYFTICKHCSKYLKYCNNPYELDASISFINMTNSIYGEIKDKQLEKGKVRIQTQESCFRIQESNLMLQSACQVYLFLQLP